MSCPTCRAAVDELRQHDPEQPRPAPTAPVEMRDRVGIAGDGSTWHRLVVRAATIRLVASLVALALLGVTAAVLVWRCGG